MNNSDSNSDTLESIAPLYSALVIGLSSI